MTALNALRFHALAFVGILLFVATGCASGTQIFVRSPDTVNDGNTLYMLVCRLDAKASASERYQEIAAKVFADPPDPSVISSQPIFPGNTVTVPIKEGDVKDIVIYFLYTNPGQNWRLPLRAPLSPEIYIDLGDHQIERVQVRKR